MSKSGRPLEPIETVTSPLDRILWLIRVHRTLSDNPAVGNNTTFARLLVPPPGRRPFTADRISKFERPAQHEAMTSELMISYERALQLAPCTLTDLYEYLSRNRGASAPTAVAVPGSARRGAGQLTEAEHDLLYMASRNDALTPAQWVTVGSSYHTIGSSLQRRHIRERLAAELPAASGADFRRLREAAARMGAEFAAPAEEVIHQHPARAAQSVETLGLLDGAVSAPLLRQLIADPPDTWMLRAVLEAYTRLFQRGHIAIHDEQAARRLQQLGLQIATNPDRGYTIRQQAARLLLTALPEGSTSRGEVLSGLRHCDDLDVIQLVRPPMALRRRILDDIVGQVRDRIGLDRIHGDDVLRQLLRLALFADDRWARDESAWVLAASPFAPALANALGNRLLRGSDRHEYQRAMNVVLTRLAQPDSTRVLQAVLADPTRHTSVHISAAWFLAELPLPTGGTDWLTHLYIQHRTPEVRRGLIYIAGRLTDDTLLRTASRDPDVGVSADAQFWLSHSQS